MKNLLCIIVLSFFSFAVYSQRNVVLIIADDVGTDWFGFYEDHVDTASMPNIRKLLSKGVRFQNAMSNPVCSPTRAGIFTGRYSFRTGVGNVVGLAGAGELDTAEITIPKLLKIYNPNIGKAQMGKWHLQSATPASHLMYPNKMGYNYFAGSFPGQLTDYYNWTKITNGVSSTSTTYATTENTNNAITWIKSQNNKPFFLWLAYNAAHTPYHVPPMGFYNGTLSGTQQDINANPKKYFKASLEALDHEVGRLFDSLAVLNKLDSTDFIFIGDNGNTQNTAQVANTTRAKGTIYQYAVHVPFIVSGPSVINPGRVSSALVNTVDIFATVLELFGYSTWQSQISVNKPVDSKSLMPIILNQSTSVRTWAFTELFKTTADPKAGKAMRNIDYKLMNFDDGHQEFYNLTNDYSEANNLLLDTLSNTDIVNYNYLCQEMSTLVGVGSYCNAAYSLPTIEITSSATSICSGTNVSFNATITNGGTSPIYQWKKNGTNVGSNSNTYSTTSLTNGDTITCVLTTASLTTATSNSIAITVIVNVTPAISITASSSTICTATSVSFNATVTNGGTSPSYQWKKNNANVGNNSSAYTDIALANGDVVSCTLTSSAVCATSSTANSNSITMAVSSAIPAKPNSIAGTKFNLCNTNTNFNYSVAAVSGATSYNWSVPANCSLISGQGTPSIVVAFSSLFKSGTLSVSAVNGCGVGIARTAGLYSATAKPGTINGLSVVCTNQQSVTYSIPAVTGATSYKWTVPTGATIASGQGSTAIVANFGTNSGLVTVVAKNACASSSKSSFTITMNCRMGDDMYDDNISIVTVVNPFEDKIIVNVNTDIDNAEVTLYDITGREIYSWKNVSMKPNTQEHFDVEKNLPKTIYFLSIKNESINIVSKIFNK
ncbi:MAG: sulfatase-like hydrolase/transferase [Bacteroidetes bacterium]|nr:sulfatase-like hydrolase/transferase [Bacteroidota bacterium]